MLVLAIAVVLAFAIQAWILFQAKARQSDELTKERTGIVAPQSGVGDNPLNPPAPWNAGNETSNNATVPLLAPVDSDANLN